MPTNGSCWRWSSPAKATSTARKLHAKAVQWMRKYRYSDFELHALDAEAEALFGLTNQPKSTAKKEENVKERSKP